MTGAALALCGPAAPSAARVFEKLAGVENCSREPLERLGTKKGRRELWGKMANITDVNSIQAIASNKAVESLRSGDPIDVPARGGKHPAPRLIFTVRDAPSRQDKDEAPPWLLVVNLQGDELNRDQEEKIHQEIAGVAAWAVRGAQRLLKQRGFSRC